MRIVTLEGLEKFLKKLLNGDKKFIKISASSMDIDKITSSSVETGEITCTTINTQNNNISIGSGTLTGKGEFTRLKIPTSAPSNPTIGDIWLS